VVIKNDQKKTNKKIHRLFEKSIEHINNRDFLKARKFIDKMGNSSSDKMFKNAALYELYARQNKYFEALEPIKYCFNQSPQSESYASAYASILLLLNKHVTVLEVINNALQYHPESQVLLKCQINTLVAQNKVNDAYVVTKKLAKEERESSLFWPIIRSILQKINVPSHMDNILESDLNLLLKDDVTRVDSYHHLVRWFISKKIATWYQDDFPIVQIDKCTTFHSALQKCLLNTNFHAEIWLTKLRQRLLLSINNTAPPTEYSSLMLSLAIHNYNNEYVFFETDEEANTIVTLINQLTNYASINTTEPNRFVFPFLNVIMYRNPNDLPFLEKIMSLFNKSDHPRLFCFINEIAQNFQIELSHTNEFLENTQITDNTTKKVANQYEENPYPRWTNKLIFNGNDIEYISSYELEKTASWQGTSSGDYKATYNQMFIAGCGTGEHPLSTAVDFPYIDITTIDVSARSLGYAVMMQKKCSISNVRIERQDILTLEQTERLYDIVECCGVLHHMENPAEGLKKINAQLKPGGIMKIALYSKIAREAVLAFRDLYSFDKQQITTKTIKELRQDIFNKNPNDKIKDVSKFGDFFTLSGCRDLLLNVKEHQFDLVEIKDILKKENLVFLKMHIATPTKEALESKYKLKKEWIEDIEILAEIENKEPDLFLSMYQFHVQKPLTN
jgi:SAM-dependent methyltransferase